MKKLSVLIMALLSFSSLYSQENLTFQKPSKAILDLVDYERAPSVSMDSKKEYMILTYRKTYKSLDDLNQDELRLAGLRINPNTNISSSMTYVNNIKVRKVRDTNEIQVVGLPENPSISYLAWSPNEKMMAFTNTTQEGVELWVIDILKAEARRLTDASLNANLGSPISWFKDNQTILVRFLPQARPRLIDPKKDLPKGPTVSQGDGSVSQNRTYQDLLKNKTDEANFETITLSELYKVNISGSKELFKGKAMYAGESFSPDGNYIMISTVEKPFSYIVPIGRFPSNTVVYDLKGNAIKTVNVEPLNEIMPKGFMAVQKGKRDMGWRNDKPATLYYAVALDEGDPEKKVEFRDEIFLWEAPFTSEPASIAKTLNRFDGITWGREDLAVMTDNWYDNRNAKTYIINPKDPSQKPRLVWDRNYQDIYSDPGSFETKKNEYGKYVLSLDGNDAILIGAGYTREGQFPFIDEFDTKSLKTKRLYVSTYKDKLENIFDVIDLKKGEVLVRIQSKNDYPNYFIRNYKKKDKLEQITFFKNPFEGIRNVHKEVIKYKRNDGVELSGTLYLPVGYEMSKKEKLPLLIWAYPQEFKDKNSAGQSNANPNEFTFPYYGSFIYWITKGYVVLDDASFPIIGEGTTEPNDTFLPQLVANAEAAINAVDALGYIDKSKVAVGGHSYGAFMTANLLTHSKLFACGIARSGAYNRTLTPFGFQSEQRNYWEAKDIYNTMSPFMNAEKMKTPLLLVHGDADNNPGTFTLQTERYFQALKGLGAPVRMVLLPKESHGYYAKENILHLLWEQEQFLDKYLK